MANLTIQEAPANAVLNHALAAVAEAGDTITPATTDQRLLLILDNANAAPRVVTINDPNTVAPAGAKDFDADVEITVPATDAVVVNLTQLGRFKDSNTGMISMTYADHEDLSVAVIRSR